LPEVSAGQRSVPTQQAKRPARKPKPPKKRPNFSIRTRRALLRSRSSNTATSSGTWHRGCRPGKTDLASLQSQLPQLTAGFNEKFQAPTGATEQNDPGYQFRLDQGMKMLDNSAAAKGGLLSGNTLQGRQNYAQNYASNEYGNVYNRAMQEYTNRFNIDSANKRGSSTISHHSQE
jgi:hypothetical protein